MASYRESKLEERINELKRVETEREAQLRRKSLERQHLIMAKKDENRLRNVYFTIQKSMQLQEA